MTKYLRTGKNWLESREKEPSRPPTENFPEIPEIPPPIFIDKSPLTPSKNLTYQDNSLIPIKTERKSAITNYQSKPLIRQISPKNQEKFFSLRENSFNKKKPFLNNSEQLPVITNRGERQTAKEQILLVKIKVLEGQLKQVQTENNNLKLENKHLKTLIRKDQETEAKILQPLPFKVKN